jgi:hypothetical protein
MERNRPRIKPRIYEWMASYSFIRAKFVDGLPPVRELRQAKANALREPRKGMSYDPFPSVPLTSFGYATQSLYMGNGR